MCSPTQVCFQHLTDIHTAGHTQRAQDDVNRRPVSQVWHIFHGYNLGDNTLVPMTTSHLVTLRDFTTLGNTHTNHRLNASGQVTVVLPIKDMHIHHFTASAMRHPQAGIFHFTRLVAKDSTQQFFFWAEFLFTFRRDLTHENIHLIDISTNANDTALVQVFERILAHIGNVVRNFFGA